MPPPTNGKRKATEAEQEEEDEFGFESDDEQDADRFPVSHEIVLKDHTKVSHLDAAARLTQMGWQADGPGRLGHRCRSLWSPYSFWIS